MFVVVQSNRLDALADALATQLRSAPLPPLESEVVVVPASGVQRWLAFALADRLGVLGSLRFVLPAAYVWSLVADVLPQVPSRSPFDAEVVQWRLMRLLARTRSEPVFEPVRHYLRSGRIGERLQLARALAERFDAYATYRPEWLEGWLNAREFELGQHESWQAALWREIVAESADVPVAHPKEAFFRALTADPAARQRLPSRLTLFNVDALPPLYLEIFERLGAHIDVACYTFNPCREYWGMIQRPSAAARQAIVAGPSSFDSDNRLFASLGQHGRALFDDLAARDPRFIDAFVAPRDDTLLAQLQRDVLDLRSADVPSVTVRDDDSSIRLHVCHSAMREAEVLHDQLLAMFDADPTLEPDDVLVLTPDPGTYLGPLEAVFASAPANRAIPFSISDRPNGGVSPVIRAWRSLIDTARGRMDAASVAALLAEPRVAGRFGIEVADGPRLRDWIEACGVRWGADAQARAELNLPPTPDHTWQAGLDRLILGAACAPGVLTLLGDIVPHDDVEGAGSLLAGKLDRFVASLVQFGRSLSGERPLASWMRLLADSLDRFLELSIDEEDDAQWVRRHVAEIITNVSAAAWSEPTVVDVALEVLFDRVDRSSRDGFGAGGVSIAALSLARIMPRRVVCLLGMNDGVFPRSDRPLGFDLIAARPRRGDRRRRDEDRYAFLKAVLAASDRLFIFYAGRSVRDDAELPPSVVVGELLDAIDRRTGGASARSQLTIEHPLQPFSVAYHRGDRERFTYATEWEAPPGPLVSERFAREDQRNTLPAVDDAPGRLVTLAELERFFAHPTRTFLRDRLGLAMGRRERELPTSEPFVLDDGLARYRVREATVESILASQPEQAVARSLAAEGLLPSGAAALVAFDRERAGARALARSIVARTGMPPQPLAPIAWTLRLGDWSLSGTLDGLTESGRLRWRAGRLRARDAIHGWLSHLVYCVVRPEALPLESVIIATDRSMHLASLEVDRARGLLNDLVAVYAEGQRRLLPLYPETSLAWVRADREGKTVPAVAAERVWTGRTYGGMRGEIEDPYVALAVRGRANPLDESFSTLAARVFSPLLDHAAFD